MDKLGNMVGGRPTTYLNVPIEDMKRYARTVLEKKLPVWFGCDMGKFVRSTVPRIRSGAIFLSLLHAFSDFVVGFNVRFASF